MVNIGGIANLSLLAGDGSVFGFDCGPGNCMMDGWIQRHKRQAYDHDGRWASEAEPSEELLRQLMNHPFVRRQAPKSACAQDFSLDWLDQCRQRVPPLPAAAVQASLMMFTAACIARSVHSWLGKEQDNALRVVLCGGGTRNGALLKAIRQQLRGTVFGQRDHGVRRQCGEPPLRLAGKQPTDGQWQPAQSTGKRSRHAGALLSPSANSSTAIKRCIKARGRVIR